MNLVVSCSLRVSMGLTVNRQMAQKLTVNRQKRNIFTVNRQMSEPKLAGKFLNNLVPRSFSLNLARGPTPKPGKRRWERV